jgi:trehalose 6-phosphate synthase
MRLSLRFILPLALAIGLIAYLVTPLVDVLTFQWFTKDLDIRSRTLTDAISAHSLMPTLAEGSKEKILSRFSQVLKDDRVFAVGFCNLDQELLYRTDSFPKDVRCGHPPSADGSEGYTKTLNLSDGPIHVAYHGLRNDDGKIEGELVLVQDMSFVQNRSATTKKYIFLFFVALAAVISLITVFIAQLSWKGWVQGIRALLKGEVFLNKPIHKRTAPELRPIVKDLKMLIREMESDRKARDESQVSWTSGALREILHEEFRGDEILIVSNREPYIHVKRGEKIEVQVPASGLVTALEPIMRACSGTWIAHGSGNADREVVDKHDRVRVPPENPSYQIRRVWLTKEEEEGYYYGFSNEGIWPLCHIAHTRPTFRSSDWRQYVEVNEKFAAAVEKEAKTLNPVILVQDYHFGLLPKMIKERLPDATVITFWHIPWPNPEAFGICPWREEILDGLLGSDILGFHTRFHCNNFIDTVDRFVQSRIDRETSTIAHGDRLTAVNHYPISIEYPSRWLEGQKPVKECRRHIRAINGLHQDHLVGIGVDRLDYTKGILERFMAVERLLELEPRWIGKFTFIQIAAPSRSTIDQYQHFEVQVREMAARINTRFGKDAYQPICLKVEHHEPSQVFEYFRAADLCFVSSLHDGMNLVSKEFVAARDDERGVLILSQFAGSSKELPEALIVNPYNADQCAAALHVALEMPEGEQRSRMRHMRSLVQEFNVYRWAGKMLIDASKLRNRVRFLGRFKPQGIAGRSLIKL